MKTWFFIGVMFVVLAGCEAPSGTPVTFTVRQGLFVHEISTRGSVFSPASTEVKCRIDGATPEGTTILEIVPEGSSVQPGDFLVRLDTSALRESLLQQQVLCNGLEAAAVAAANELEKAQLAREEYVNGLYPEEKKAAEDDLFAAEKKLERATHALEAAKNSDRAPEGPSEDIDTLRFNVEMAKRDVEGAKNRVCVLDNYTKPRLLKQLQGDVDSAEAMNRAKETELSLQQGRLAKIEEQIAACTITAPVAGVVFYANAPGETEEEEVLIAEGVAVRNRQVILRLAQLDRLSVRGEVAESEIAAIRKDMPATIYVDAMPDTPFDGHVSMVHPFPTRETLGNTDGKKYEIDVVVDNPSGTLKPGLTAEVVLTLKEVEDAIQVPASSVLEENDTKFCLVRRRNRWKRRPVVLGPTDDKLTVIREGLEPGEEVAIHPLEHLQQASE